MYSLQIGMYLSIYGKYVHIRYKYVGIHCILVRTCPYMVSTYLYSFAKWYFLSTFGNYVRICPYFISILYLSIFGKYTH